MRHDFVHMKRTKRRQMGMEARVERRRGQITNASRKHTVTGTFTVSLVLLIS